MTGVSALRLRSMVAADLPVVSRWFTDPDTRRFLGGPDWPARMLTLGASQVGTGFRGARQTGSYRWLGEVDGEPVGYLDCGTFDRWTTCGQAPDGQLTVLDAIERPAGSICFTTAPEHRHRGIARAMIRTMLALPELADIQIIGAGVEPANTASLACLRALGFQLTTSEPDWEGMLYLLLDRAVSRIP